MRRIIFPVVLLLTAMILTGGFFLPSYVSAFKDLETIGKRAVTDGVQVNFETKSELSIIDRLKMITTASSISLDNGQNMDIDSAYQNALTELGKFNSKSVMNMDVASCRLAKAAVSFYIDATDPSKNIIVWNIVVEEPGYTIVAYLDDETGKLLALSYNLAEPDIYDQQRLMASAYVNSPIVNADLLAASIVDYYGLDVAEPEIENNPNALTFVLILSDGQNSMKIQTEVANNAFWMNI